VMVNVGGFYDSLLAFFDHAVEQGLIKPENRSLIRVAQNACEALEIIEREWNQHADLAAHDGKLDELVK
jgi:predicted Rossmann-fold nucleotide-binding protein